MKLFYINKILQVYLFWIAFASVSGFPFETLSEFEEKVAKAACGFTLKLLQNAESQHNSSNIVFSSASINFLLSILQQGANGNTATELQEALGLTPEESLQGYRSLLDLKKEENVTLEWGNRCYLKPELELIDEYRKLVEENFNVKMEKMNFGIPTPQDSADKINKWVEEVTHERIKDLIDAASISQDTVMVMINAIFFKGKWAKPYKKGKTVLSKFETNSEDFVETLFMSQREKFYSFKDTTMGAKWVHQPFQNERFSMVFVLPTKRHSLNQLIKGMKAQDLYIVFNRLRVSQVKLRIPKFKVSQKVSLVDTLQKVGLKDLFNAGASDLSGMTSPSLTVSDIIHQANVEIDEEGSTSSAATIIDFTRSRTLTMSFVADQPFLFFIIDNHRKIPLFAGKILNPQM